MKNYLSILFILSLSFNSFVFAQESEEEVNEDTTVEALLALVKQGRTKEQTENTKREARFMANKNKQAQMLAEEKEELKRQEDEADRLEAIYKKQEEQVRIAEEAYQKELGSLVEIFGHLQSSAGEAAVQFLAHYKRTIWSREGNFLND